MIKPKVTVMLLIFVPGKIVLTDSDAKVIIYYFFTFSRVVDAFINLLVLLTNTSYEHAMIGGWMPNGLLVFSIWDTVDSV
jgi:hypothetical protein